MFEDNLIDELYHIADTHQIQYRWCTLPQYCTEILYHNNYFRGGITAVSEHKNKKHHYKSARQFTVNFGVKNLITEETTLVYNFDKAKIEKNISALQEKK